MTDKPVLNTPGELLLAARRAAGLEIDEVSTRTKIPVAILHSLERDEYHKVSGPLYVNSFLRTYAADVGVEPALVVEAYAKFSGEHVGGGAEPDAEAVWTEEEVEIRRVGMPWALIGAIAGGLTIVVAAGIWIAGTLGDDAVSPAGTAPGRAVGAQSPETGVEPVRGDIPVAGPSGEEVPEETEVPRDGTGAKPEDAGSQPHESAREPVQEQERTRPETTASRSLPAAEPGLPTLAFGDGNRWPLVLRLLADEPVGVRVRRDAERDPAPVDWPRANETVPALPTVGVRHGQPYRTQDGWAVYWGARDQFSLRLDRTRGVDVSLNGEPRDLSGLQPGQELILFLPADRR